MRFVRLPASVIERIKQLDYSTSNERTIKRAQAILMSSNGISRTKISEIINVTPDTISIWFEKIEEDNNWDLKELPGRGRKPLIDCESSKKI